jgi:hypothetical protein
MVSRSLPPSRGAAPGDGGYGRTAATITQHAFEQVAAPHLLTHERRHCVQAGHHNGEIGRESTPFGHAALDRGVACPEPRQGPHAEHIEAAIRRGDDAHHNRHAKENVEGVMRRSCNGGESARVSRRQDAPETSSPGDASQQYQAGEKTEKHLDRPHPLRNGPRGSTLAVCPMIHSTTVRPTVAQCSMIVAES